MTAYTYWNYTFTYELFENDNSLFLFSGNS